MFSCTISQAVSRAPCRNGRVSSAITEIFLPASTAERNTPSAVPHPAVAKAPALQCVSTRAPSFSKAAPCAPIALLMRISSARISCASSNRRCAICCGDCVATPSQTLRIRCNAQNRFTAVGRLCASTVKPTSMSSLNSTADLSWKRNASSATP